MQRARSTGRVACKVATTCNGQQERSPRQNSNLGYVEPAGAPHGPSCKQSLPPASCNREAILQQQDKPSCTIEKCKLVAASRHAAQVASRSKPPSRRPRYERSQTEITKELCTCIILMLNVVLSLAGRSSAALRVRRPVRRVCWLPRRRCRRCTATRRH